MRVTFLGHAGLYVETRHGSILCDPWFNSAFFSSWFPFPSNEHLDRNVFARPDYLYISHIHEDHLDREFLREHVSKDATVILPDHPLPLVRRELEALGFTSFVQTTDNVPLEVGGLRVMTVSTSQPRSTTARSGSSTRTTRGPSTSTARTRSATSTPTSSSSPERSGTRCGTASRRR